MKLKQGIKLKKGFKIKEKTEYKAPKVSYPKYAKK